MPATRSIFHRIPFIRITGLFLLGILLQRYLTFDNRFIAILCTTLISILLFLWRNSNFSVIQIQNYLISILVILVGVFYPVKVQERPLPSFDRKDYYMAEICQKPSEKAKTYQAVLRIQNKTLIKPEKVVAYFSKENYDSTLTTGDQIIILAKPQPIRNMGNPFEFDYRLMMQSRDIWYSVYLTKETYLNTGKKSDRIIYLAEQIRDQLIAKLSKVIPAKEERSVVSALTLGYRTEISQETNDYFASTGAMHVLSVSGLHVALIYFVLGFFLSFIKRGKAGTAIFALLMISFLWLYAFISGFSPSVQRATVMFSFVIIGNLLRRPANIFNTLLASALLLILLSPQVIYDIGFQLSYLAVFGIVLIQPVLNKLIEVNNPILKWIWSLTTVSVAAQLTTFPLGLFYFNQFPNLFWLSNFMVIPATTLIIWLTIAFFVFAPFQSIATLLGIIIQKITHLMLETLKAIDALPYAVSQGIVLNPLQVVLLFMCITVIIIFFASKRKGWLISLLVLILFFQLNVLVENYMIFNQKAVIVYNSKNLMIHLIDGRKNYLVTNSFKNLSESEKSTLEKARFNLKLNRANYLEMNQPIPKEIGDLSITKDRIQFINSEIVLSSNNTNSTTRDQINLFIYPSEVIGKVTDKKIYTGNSGAFGVENPDLFRTKLNGAFYASLKME
jgi:competence protein ComEC